MADNVNIPAQGTGDTTPVIAADDVGGVKHQRVKVEFGADGVATDVSAAAPLPVVQTGTPGLPAGASTETSVAASATALGAVGDAAYVSGSGSVIALLKGLFAKLPALVSGRVPVDGSGVTQPVSGTVTANAGTGTLAVSGPVTDTQLRATPVPVSGTVTVTPPSNASTNLAQVAGATVAQGHGTAAAALRVELPTDGTGVVGLAAGAATIGALAANQSVNQAQVAGTAVATSSGALSAGVQRVTLATDQVQLTNALKVDPSGVTSPVSLASVPSHAVTNAGTFAVQAATELATGLTTFSNTALSNTKTAVKASAGKVYGWMVHNPSAATAYIQVWNVAIGSITVGTTAPTWTIPLPAGASANVMSERGITHSTEINVAATTTPTGSTAPATALVVGIFYI